MSRLIRLNEVMNLTALSRSAIYRKMKTGEFPQSVNIGDRAVAWVEQDIKEWIAFVIERGSDDKRR
ncbi:AlpA family transcriptional regulator [Vibrio tubiashii]|uniref:AlpA family transcriptional regulator n=1 Tax=Vibrio tubiashii TaxID=29498 RepID=UPI001EFE72E5|nr:AlpA family transcriptional regulator [Vibrio tubiashii]MCG9582968.1 AlpA family transcriptional regulator [Vibrio tubiashii]MCG9616562.1 AlpA family transcriptional regulator [Vibrio tubiashii]MCG9688295.1 AlpA family transcriptional regulator [Vibrio tubiashii]